MAATTAIGSRRIVRAISGMNRIALPALRATIPRKRVASQYLRLSLMTIDLVKGNLSSGLFAVIDDHLLCALRHN